MPRFFAIFMKKEGAPATTVLGITQDKEGFMWFATSRGLYRYDSRTFKKYLHDPQNPNSLPTDYLETVFCDSKGRLWLGSRYGLSLYDPAKDNFTTYSDVAADPKKDYSMPVFSIGEDEQNGIWVGTMMGLRNVRMERGTVKFLDNATRDLPGQSVRIHSIANGKKGEFWLGTRDGLVHVLSDRKVKLFKISLEGSAKKFNNSFRTILIDQSGRIWLGTDFGLWTFDPGTAEFQPVKGYKRENGAVPGVNKIISDKQGKLWIASEMGLANFDPVNEQIRWFLNQPDNPLSLADDVLYSMCKDRQGGLWLGSYFLGINYLNMGLPGFAVWPSREEAVVPVYKDAIMGITRSNRHWVVSDDRKGIWIKDSKTKRYRFYDLKLDYSEAYYCFYVDEDDVVWCGGNSILTSYDLKRKIRLDHPLAKEGGKDSRTGRIVCLFEDSKGRFWVSGFFGLLQFTKKIGEVRPVKLKTAVYSIFEDSKKTVWFGGHAVHYLEQNSYEIKKTPVNKAGGMNNFAYVRGITEDPSGRVWFAVEYGIQFYDSVKKKLISLTTEESAGTDNAMDIQADLKGYLWINAESKLIRYHPDKRTIQTYDAQDGLPNKGILIASRSIKDRQGILYFATSNGIVSFNPQKTRSDEKPSELGITSLLLFNKEVTTGDKSGILDRAINEMEEITFHHDQNIFTLNFALRSYFSSDRNQYAYKLEGFEKDWNYVQNPSATYTNLPSGKYTFMVKAANGDGYWNPEPTRLTIVVLAPWWKTWYAYLVYALLVGLALYGIVRFFALRSSLRKENELYQTKLDFFTNISHEIRTHLSLIGGPLERAFRSPAIDSDTERHLARAKNNSDRLMILVNELLDFRKIQNGSVKLQVTEQDVVRVLRSTLVAFEHQALEKSIKTKVVSPENPLPLWFDPTQMQKVFYNLLSNAYKFTQIGGTVTITLKQLSNEVVIAVANTGTGIAPEFLSRVFNNFFQVSEATTGNTGYGIGLALAKEIVGRHSGNLSVTSVVGSEGEPGETCFTVRLLKGKRHFNESELVTSSLLRYAGEAVPEELPVSFVSDKGSATKNTILLIEDNEELREFTKETFRDSYTILEADNGEKGLEMARENVPDLVLCDIMMPGLSGLEVCRRLKADTLYSHIPILLLTARSTVPQVIEGLEAGADDYLIKPFDFKVLELKISNLIRAREVLRQQYQQALILEQDTVVINDSSGDFVERLRGLVIENMIDPDFGVNQMAHEVGVSVSVLYRKLRSVTGMTVNEFTKVIRMKRARQLLESGTYNVNEVATAVGFEDSKYFSREFRKVYEKTPNEVRRQSGNVKEELL